MHGFKIAIATKDKAPEDLITMGTDIIANETQGEMEDAEASIIDYVDIFFDTTDNDVKQKSGSMLAKVEIRGNIPQAPELMKKFRKLSEWAHDRSAETTYRDICIAVKSAENSFQVVGWSGHNDFKATHMVLKFQIDSGYPIPCLTLYHKNPLLRDYVWHWFLLTGYEVIDDNWKVKVVSYGVARWFDFDMLWDTGFSNKGGLIVFQ